MKIPKIRAGFSSNIGERLCSHSFFKVLLCQQVFFFCRSAKCLSLILIFFLHICPGRPWWRAMCSCNLAIATQANRMSTKDRAAFVLSEENSKVRSATYNRQTSTRPGRRTATCVAAVLHLFWHLAIRHDAHFGFHNTETALFFRLILATLHYRVFLPTQRGGS